MTTRATRTPRRRTVVALAVVLVVLVTFVVRLVDIQVVNARALEADAISKGMQMSITLNGSRGEIVDENGVVLAGNVKRYAFDVNPQNIFERKTTADGLTADARWQTESAELASITGQDVATVRKIVADSVAKNPDSMYAEIASGLTTEQYQAIVALDLPYVHFTSSSTRTYPAGAVGSNVIGLVGGDGQALAGLELAQDACLEPTDGKQTFGVGKDGVIIPGTTTTNAGSDGGTLKLTINSDLQWYMQQLIAEQVQNQQAQYGTVMVVEVKTGKIRAAAEYPTFDPNDIDASKPEDRGSRIFQASFEPGSTFKPVTAAAAIEDAGVTPTSPTVPAASVQEVNGIKIGDVDYHPSYNYTLTGALVDSSNVATSQFGLMTSQQQRYDMLQRFGVGQSTGLGFPGEPATTLHPTPWNNALDVTTNFGQGFTVTVPQVASVYQTIANGGTRIPLSLIEGCTHADGTVDQNVVGASTQAIQPSTADQIKLMMENVYQQVHNHDVIAIDGYRAATKTGTAQEVDPGTGAYKAGVFYTTMAGFAPADDPQYAVILTLDEPQKNRLSSANAPGWQKAMTQTLKTYRVLPSTQSGPEILPKYK
ncbi:penicillin-binding protein 2 [uncultured Microbacterium sp.]|uniref:peptidoglycan D,D-transpeptidase FtsI family protein n=1 Tax=uncultured Microbacterium sp. TaxID=191216 RepID=UPI0025D2CA38|nr:penicillin-binding protein 2 [uncultured Microbacterium sp.]